jgi:hypothetical protein
MAGPIYKLYMGKATEAWYQLSEEERNSLLDKIGPEKAGGKTLVACNSGWSSEQWQWFGIEEFPDIEAVQQHAEDLEEVGWSRYKESVSVLGTKWEGS